jgi:RNAse (barnase) inhibitor barstar
MEAQTLQDMLQRAENNGVYHLPTSGREAMQQAAEAAGLVFHLVRLDDTEDHEDALTRIGSALKFPEWYGVNFDALYDCLTDLSWQETGATVIVLTGCDALKSAAPEPWETLLNVFGSAAEYWQNEETPFWVFIDMRADGLAYLPTVA